MWNKSIKAVLLVEDNRRAVPFIEHRDEDVCVRLAHVFSEKLCRPLFSCQGRSKTALNFNAWPLRVGFESHEARAMRRTRSMTEAA
jgi:hypothetical protein